MEALKHKLLYSILGASSGLSGLISLTRCPGNACTSCFGCAGVGIGVVLITLLSRFKRSDGRKNGMA